MSVWNPLDSKKSRNIYSQTMISCTMLVVAWVDSNSCLLEDQSGTETQGAKTGLFIHNLGVYIMI